MTFIVTILLICFVMLSLTLYIKLNQSALRLKDLEEVYKTMASKKTESLGQVEDYYHALIEEIPAGVIVVGKGGKIDYANSAAERLLAKGAKGIKKTPLARFIGDFELSKKIDEAFKGKEIDREIVVKRPEERILRSLISPIKKGDKVQGAVVILEDVTRLRRLEATRQELVSSFSHELRTPIASCQAALEALTEWKADKDPEERKRFLTNLTGQVERLSALVTEMMQLTRLESGSSILNKRKIEAYDLVKAVVAAVEVIAQAKGVTVEHNATDGLTVNVDPQLFGQALINLADNAVKFTDKGGLVRIEAHADGNRAVFRVSDTGVGIPKDALPHIFERFYRVDKHRSREAGGTGLGLALTKHIIEAHKGKIAVESVMYEGSTFSIIIRKA